MNAISTEPVQSLKWYEVWREVFLHPSEKTFDRILADPTATPNRAYIWVAIMSTLIGILGQFFSLNFTIPSLFIAVVFSPIFGLIGLASGALLLHWIAKRYKGQGTYSRMVYALGAIFISPYYMIYTFLQWVLSSQELLSSLVLEIFALFMVYLTAQAIKAVERINTGQAYWTLILPVLLMAVLAVFVIVALAFLSPAIGAGVR